MRTELEAQAEGVQQRRVDVRHIAVPLRNPLSQALEVRPTRVHVATTLSAMLSGRQDGTGKANVTDQSDLRDGEARRLRGRLDVLVG